MTRWLGAVVAVAVAFGLGLYHLSSRSLWGDEAFSVTLARKPAGEFWHVVATSQANMSLYYVLLRGWIKLGDGEAACIGRVKEAAVEDPAANEDRVVA